MRLLTTLLLLVLLSCCTYAQTWVSFDKNGTNGDQRISPFQAHNVRTDAGKLHKLLFSAPDEKAVSAATSSIHLKLPTPAGSLATFKIVSYDISEATALEKYPEIRTWYGVNVADPTQSVFLDWTERGFHASVRGGTGSAYFIDPIYREDLAHYQVYTKADLDKSLHPFTCFTESDVLDGVGLATVSTNKSLGDCELMQYRTTMTATGEYSNYHGATSAAQSGLVQSAIVTTINRVNQILSRNLSLRLQLVGNNDLLYSYDPDNDPFPVNDVGDLIGDNTPYVNSIIGVDNYDYGHIVSQGGGGGIASLAASCRDNRKAAGATSLGRPEGDFFDVDYVAHEMGHNFGGNHTQNNDCNYSSSAGMEPGSGSTIMSYAGICTPNVQNQVDDYFHGRSIEEMTTHFELGNGGCGTIINTSLTNASILSPMDETIPAGTPFVLTSGATGDGSINYNWEQYDVERGAVMPPVGTNEQGPLFRSLPATASPKRYFPQLPDVINGTTSTWEAMPTISRALNFRATVLNYNAAYGCAVEDDMTVEVTADAPPFTVLDPVDNAHQWSAGQLAQVRWNVGLTDQAPINSQLMDILLSTDGGATFQTLVADTPNDGYVEVTAPNQPGNQNRIMVRSKDNVFYNVSTTDFSVVSNQGAPTVTVAARGSLFRSDCFAITDTATFSFVTTSTGGAEAPITWSVEDLPTGLAEVYSVNPSLPGGSFELTLEGLTNLPLGTTTLSLSGTSTDGTFSETITLEKVPGTAPAGPANLAPNTSAIDLRPTFTAAAQADVTYEIQVATVPDFSNLIYSLSNLTTPSFTVPTYLTGNTTYFWRVRTVSTTSDNCGISFWSEASFTTADCQLFPSTGAPQFIPNTAPPISVSLSADVPLAGTILDVDLFQLDLEHTYLQDLEVELIHPDGTSALLWDEACGPENNIFASFDDEATEFAPCPPTNGDFYRSPGAPLSRFDGLPMAGTWTLRVDDNAEQDGGSLNSFALKICREAPLTLPVTFLSFQATPQKDHILLNWETEEEVNNRGFMVERSLSGANHWEELGFVFAGGAYTFPDRTAAPHTDYVYRLRQEDHDGQVSYSSLTTARFGEVTGVLLFPNPTDNLLQYQLPQRAVTSPYQLLNINGQVVGEGLLQPAGGSISLQELPGGVYFLRTEGQSLKVTKL